MSRRATLRACFVLAMLLPLVGLSASDAEAQRRGRPQINRSGPASHGSFGRGSDTHRQSQRARDPGPDRDRERGPDPGPDRFRDRGPDPGPDRFREREAGRQRYPDADRDPDPDRRPDPDRVRDERRDRRDDYRDDRRDRARRHRAWRHGTQLTYVEWTDYDCSNEEVVDGGASLFECDGVWFVRTYYGGEVVYTVTDPPSGY
jgi:hypothetical protein